MSPNSTQLVKAYLYNEDSKQKVVDCLFNPTEYAFTKNNSWEAKRVMGKNVPMVNFQGGGIMTLTVSLLFDTSLAAGQPDVRKYTEKVLKLMEVDESLKDSKNKKGRPPRVSFRWGQYWSFKSVIVSINQRFTLFKPDGQPVRATLDVTFQQVESEGTYPPTNPTSYAEVNKVRVVMPGETIDSVAFDEYGDAKCWKLLADHNEIDDPMHLKAGQKLTIPPLP